jgi:hypothetical protein
MTGCLKVNHGKGLALCAVALPVDWSFFDARSFGLITNNPTR